MEKKYERHRLTNKLYAPANYFIIAQIQICKVKYSSALDCASFHVFA